MTTPPKVVKEGSVELKSRPFEPHPLFASFVQAAVMQSRLV
jgi:CTP synthase (UTP-ammonia lyase)